jgi:hypothetical protein
LTEPYKFYAIDAFRHYAAIGKPTYEQLKMQIWNEALFRSKQDLENLSGVSDPAGAAVINAEEEVEQRTGELLDVLAVNKVIQEIDWKMRQTIEIVYMDEPERQPIRGEVRLRQLSASLVLGVSDRTIRDWLQDARELFALKRKLRL